MASQFMLRYVTEEVQQATKEQSKKREQSQNAFILSALTWATDNKNRYRYEDVWCGFNIFQEDAKASKKFIVRFEDPKMLDGIKSKADFHLRSVNSELNIMIMTYLHHVSL